jgi:hypothetical protein
MAASVTAETPMKPIPKEWSEGLISLNSFLVEVEDLIKKDLNKLYNSNSHSSVKEPELVRKNKQLLLLTNFTAKVRHLEAELRGILIVIDLNE